MTHPDGIMSCGCLARGGKIEHARTHCPEHHAPGDTATDRSAAVAEGLADLVRREHPGTVSDQYSREFVIEMPDGGRFLVTVGRKT